MDMTGFYTDAMDSNLSSPACVTNIKVFLN